MTQTTGRTIGLTALMLAVGTAIVLIALAAATRAQAPKGGDAAANAWPGFRGPGSSGLAANPGDPPVYIDLTRDTRWSVEVPEPGNSSPIVWGERIYLTGGDGHVMAFERATGALAWDTALNLPAEAADPGPEAPDAGMPAGGGGDAGPACPTPVTDGKFVYASFGDSSLACVQATDGREMWVKRLVPGKVKNMYGLAASPVLYGDAVIQVIDRGNSPEEGLSFVAALRTKDGSEAWRVKRPTMSGWASPCLAHGADGDVLVTANPPLIIAYNPKTGAELWHADGPMGEYCTSPVPCGQGLVAVITDSLCAMKLAARGDATKSGVAWTNDDRAEIASPVCDGKRCVQACKGEIDCIDAATGKTTWKLEDLDGEFYAAPALTKDRVYAITKEGLLYVVSNDGKKLAQADLKATVNASPAILDGRIYIRTVDKLMCIGKP